MVNFKFLLIVVLFNTNVLGEINEEINIKIECRNKVRLLGLDKDDQFEYVTVKKNATLVLLCHYCKETENFAPKIWYTESRLTDEPIKEVKLGMSSKLSDNRVYSTPDHRLIINEITENDAARYFCHGPKEELEEYKYNFMVDVVPKNIPEEYGKLKDWEKYSLNISNEFNNKFLSSKSAEYTKIRNLNITMHLVFHWTRWGQCNGCTKIRRRTSECRLKSDIPTKERYITYKEEKFLNSYEISCHSLLLSKFYPNISEELKTVVNYVLTESCYAPCKVIGFNSMPKYRNTIVLIEGDHVNLVCPEATLENDVIWLKNGIQLQTNIKEGNVQVDSFYNLGISSAHYQDEGNYTCLVDGEKIQEVIIVVQVRSVISSKAFIRHIQHLGFIFIFSLIFYAAGLIITCTRRDTFKQIDDFKDGYIRLDRKYLT